LITANPHIHPAALHLASVAAWQAQLLRDPGIDAVFGPDLLLHQGRAGHAQGPPSDVDILTALAHAPPGVREVAGFAINLDHGTDAIRISVIERTGRGAGRPGDPVRIRLERAAKKLAAATHTTVAVGGPAANLQDFTAASIQRLPLLVAVLACVTFLILAIVLRSVLVAAVAVLLNVLTITAALGILVICFQGSAPFGGAGSLDAVITPAIVSVSFGLAIDYEVFLLARIREHYLLVGDIDAAVEYGLRRTAGIITGAALIMTAVFVAFASAKIMNLREFGVGLTAAVVLDATLVRLVLLPAVLRLLGTRAWRIPSRIDRRASQGPEPVSGLASTAAE
uniref:MMPL family transporter n=1 Tax=Pseudomonas sp. TaxID=306 RepID=UPI002618F547